MGLNRDEANGNSVVVSSQGGKRVSDSSGSRKDGGDKGRDDEFGFPVLSVVAGLCVAVIAVAGISVAAAAVKGRKSSQAARARFCPRCGGSVQPGAAFCPRCGGAVKG